MNPTRRRMSARSWAGEVHLGDGWLCFLGPLGSTSPHAHHATQVVLADEPFRLQDGEGKEITARGAVIPAGAVHALTGHGQPASLLYLQHLGQTALPDLASWATRGVQLRGPARTGDLANWVASVSTHLRQRGDDPEGVVGGAMRAARSTLPGRVVLGDIAGGVGVAPTTLSRQFTHVVGVSWRRWVLTERLRLAAECVADGANLTEAAHVAGFADSAHLTRTFRRMFGIAPSDLTAVATWQVH